MHSVPRLRNKRNRTSKNLQQLRRIGSNRNKKGGVSVREIKVRIWLPGIKKMTYPHTIEELMNWGTKEWTNGTAEFLQYTGLKDKNGKEIYEGDIVESFHRIYDGGEIKRNVVEFNDFCWRLVAIGDDMVANAPLGLYAGQLSAIMVIGNIYEKTEPIDS